MEVKNKSERISSLHFPLEAIMKEEEKDHRLRSFAFKKFTARFHSHSYRGIRPEDIISDVITDLLCGRVEWNREKHPLLREFLYCRIFGCIHNLSRETVIKTVRYHQLKDEMILRKEKISLRKRHFGRLLSELKKHFASEPDTALRVLASMEKFYWNNRKISDDTKLSVNEVINARRRIRRKARSLLKQLAQSAH